MYGFYKRKTVNNLSDRATFLLGVSNQLDAWVSNAVEGEHRTEACNRIIRCLMENSPVLDLSMLNLKKWPNIFHLSDFSHIKKINIKGNLLPELPMSLQQRIKDKQLTISRITFDRTIKVCLVPHRNEYIEAGLLDVLWTNKSEQLHYKKQAINELRAYMSMHGSSTLQQAKAALYQPCDTNNNHLIEENTSASSIVKSMSI